ncbi:hypothetical protein [Ramlibacter albus]|uniref:Uncharacterized protein n=1 Tax=Ramlibacter albus TaxID=2079448 RepID=A0A923S5S0_9BURK|nr:hypothetical protein [Ramlibacter albus]MBC5768308.1 hypothetical protein [Ramlibacter albus]
MSSHLLPALLEAHGAQVADEAWPAFHAYFHARLRLRENPEQAVRAQMAIYGEACRDADRALRIARRTRGDAAAAAAARAAAEEACAARDAQKAMLVAAMHEAHPAARLKLMDHVKAAFTLLPLQTRESLVRLAELLLERYEAEAAIAA